ncbi:MAG: DNA polymerase III subunit alpha [Candidatus Babeliaceae bacterium]|nr:DNA polymerase III subunit alpha [Candidatus Babeliaceae bacterium]
MSEKHFTHLHLHTDYSLLDGAITIDKLVDFGKKNNMKALAISDHGNIFGGVKFFQAAKKAGIKPVLGMEAYFTQDIKIKKADDKYYHLILLVENEIGYKNLCRLIHRSYTDGFYFKPRIDYAALEEYSQGLIATTACLGGHIPSLLMENNHLIADERIDWFLKVFGEERFYLEIQPDDQQEQKILNEKLYDLSKRKGVQLVAAGDCHYTTAQDRYAHEIMLAIQTHHKITDPGRFTFGDCRVHMRTQDEMLELFKLHQEAVWNSGKIADRCNFSYQTGKLFFPQFEVPQNLSHEEYFAQLCKKGLSDLHATERFPHDQLEQYQARLELEINLITKMGFVGYFLVVSDFIQWARSNNIPVGPGRGSAAGSLVAWALQITDIDPIRYNLLFERFLNPERVSMPDIDIDFCIEGRERVIDYVRTKYGHDKVCQIITFGTMLAKGVIKDVARALSFPFEDSNALTDLIPDQLKITLTQACELEPKLQELRDSNPRITELFDIALRLEGLTRHASKHAAGIVISPEPIKEVLPVYIPPKTTDLVTQYAMTELETLGFLKMDFLGLKNLTLIQRTLELIEKNHALKIDITKLPLDDEKSFQLLCAGRTSGVFQLESDGLKDTLRRLQPTKFEDIIAVNALYRPGPLGSGMVDDFIERRHGRQKIPYLFPELKEILEETYGVIVYQEQVMKIASAIGGFSLGESDILRRAMGKKKADVMAEQKDIFVNRAQKRGFNTQKAGELFDLMAYFAGYGFNKSHSAAYALIAYQTAYLKAQYPAEFMACLISLESSDAEKMAFYIAEAREMGISILPPDINVSENMFTAREMSICFGLQGIKNVGQAALESIITERKKLPYKDLYDFCLRVDLRTVNKRVIESLIYAGAYDKLPGNRAQKLAELSHIIDQASEAKEALITGQMGLFGSPAEQFSDNNNFYAFAAREELSDKEKLEKEKEVVGLYISAQPLDRYKKQTTWLQAIPFSQAAQKQGLVTCCGTFKSHKVITTKKGDKMAFLFLEDSSTTAEIILFPKVYSRVAALLEDNTVFAVKGFVDEAGTGICKIKAQELVVLDKLFDDHAVTQVTIGLPEDNQITLLESIKALMQPGKTALSFILTDNNKNIKLATRQKITITPQILDLVDQYQLTMQLEI